MDVRILAGRLTEFPTPDGTGVARRAIGTLVVPRRAVGSYAFGWTTGMGHGYLTVGIGAGYPGGATIHATVFDGGGEYGLALTDEPFADVPGGGPHLTAAQARAHENFAVIWEVADQVLQQDRRAWWMRHWLLRTRCFQTPQVFELSEPVLLIHNDEDDELWQLIGKTDPGDDGKIAHLSHAIADDPTLMDVLDLAPGGTAIRKRRGGSWTRDPGNPTIT